MERGVRVMMFTVCVGCPRFRGGRLLLPLGLVLLSAKTLVIIPLDLEQLLEVVLAVDHALVGCIRTQATRGGREREKGREGGKEREQGEGKRMRRGRENSERE